MSLRLGAIADDFTGASDLAGTLVKQGVNVTLVIGLPDEATQTGDAGAVVIALKTRTVEPQQAVSESLTALRWLESRGAQQFFFKYCSTFDSTPAGNIGPVCDALMQALDCDFAFLCPAYPGNGRTVSEGKLYVGEQLLSESPMKDHPLTPMRDASLVRVMDAQSTRRSGLIPLQQVREGKAAVTEAVEALRSRGFAYGVVDAVSDEDLLTIGAAAADHRLVTGGAGIAMGLAGSLGQAGSEYNSNALPRGRGRELVLAGSCSAATRAQVAVAKKAWPARRVDVDALAAGADVADELVAWAQEQDPTSPVLIYASADPEEVSRIQQRHGVEAAGAMIEEVMGEVARRLVSDGFRRLVVAGGETSGAVVSALDIRALRIGSEIDPGVPWTGTLDDRDIAIALKSGNFGSEDFFDKAFRMLRN